MPAGQTGRAKCKECGTDVEAEVKTDIVCPGCGRKFQIPNEPRYMAKSPLANHSISVLAPRVCIETHSLSREIQEIQNLKQEEVWWTLKPYVRPPRKKKIKVSVSLSDQEPEIIEDANGALVVLELPGHYNLEEDIEINRKGNLLFIESKKFSLKKEVSIPNGEIENIRLLNGIFSLFIKKEKE